MLHVGDTVETLITGRWYKVAAIYAGHAVADGLHNPNDQISIPLTEYAQEIVHTTQFAKVTCGHWGAKVGTPDYPTALLEAYARNFGAADSAIHSLASTLVQVKLAAQSGSIGRESALLDRMHDSITSYLETAMPTPNADGTFRSPHVIKYPQEFRQDNSATDTTGDPE
jgi:hypothetical protein